MWGAIAGILGVSVVLAAADALAREWYNRPPPPEQIEDKQAASQGRKRPKRHSGSAREILQRVKQMTRK